MSQLDATKYLLLELLILFFENFFLDFLIDNSVQYSEVFTVLAPSRDNLQSTRIEKNAQKNLHLTHILR